MRVFPALVAIASPLVLAGCGGSSDDTDTTASTAPAPTRAAPPARLTSSAPASARSEPTPLRTRPPAPDRLAGFAPDEVLFVEFKEIDETGRPIVTITNLTGRDIDDIRGSFRLHDADGTILHSTGLTIAVPGDLFLAAGATDESSPFGLDRRQELMQRLATTPDALSFSFEARAVTFMETHASAE